MIDAGNSKIPKPFTVEKHIPLLWNITLAGINGRPVITGSNLTLPTFLFKDEVPVLNTTVKYVTIQVVNIWFKRIGIVKATDSSMVLYLKISDCTVSETSYHDTSFMESSAVVTNVTITNGLIYNFSQLASLNSSQVRIKIENSSVQHKADYNAQRCSHLLFISQCGSLVVELNSSEFRQVFIVNMTPDKHRIANINIFKCRFDDESTHILGSKCHSGMRLQNTTTIIADTHFSNIASRNGMICVSSSRITFQKCLFKSIRSQSSPLAVYLNSTVSFFGCQFDDNVAFRNTGAVFLSGSNGLFQDCTFSNNSVCGLFGKGGAIAAAFGSLLNIRQSSFKWNKATYLGGAIYYQKKVSFTRNLRTNSEGKQFNVKISQCLFESNYAATEGGAVSQIGDKLFVNTTTFQKNSAGRGGAILIDMQSDVDIFGCNFNWNKATVYAGAILHFGGKLAVTSTKFEYNNVVDFIYTKGGAIYTGKKSSTELFTCYFNGNVATISGGAIMHFGDTLSAINTTFEYNAALGPISSMGGAITVGLESNLNLSSCYFKSNKALTHGGAIVHLGNELLATYTIFEGNTVGIFAGAIFTGDQSVVTLYQCQFNGNKAISNETVSIGGAIFHTGIELSVISTQFRENSAMGQIHGIGGAIAVGNESKSMNVSFSSFHRNKAKTGGGAIMFYGKTLRINKTQFMCNMADVSKAARGGAICTSDKSDVHVSHSLFDGNTAKWTGGTINHQGGNLIVRNSSFQTTSYTQHQQYFGGEIIFTSGKLSLKKVSMYDMLNNSVHDSLLMHTGRFQNIKIQDINVTCYRGKRIIANLPENTYLTKRDLPGGEVFVSLSISCSSCPQNSYSLFAGSLGPSVTNQTQVQCYTCPFGGSCSFGQLRAANNFWGCRIKNSEEIRFTACPFGYCCVGNQCENYNSCAKGRKSVLCGQCKPGLTENVLTADCLTAKNCRHPWFWLVVFLAGMLYVVFFMYLKEIANFAAALLIAKDTVEYLRMITRRVSAKYDNLRNETSQANLRINNTSLQSIQCSEMRLELFNTTEPTEPSDDKTPNATLLPGAIKIVVFFYQTSVLFKIYSVNKRSGFIHLIKEITVTLFSLRTDGLFYQGLSWCPFDHLQSVSKLLFKTSFTFYLFIVIFVIFLISKMAEALFMKKNLRAFYSRLHCCMLTLLLMSYATVTVSCFTLLSCVDIGPIGKVLHIDGSIHCYQWWQVLVIAIVCMWIASYPLAIYAASWLLHRHKLCTRTFLLSFLMPFPVIFYWIYIRICCHKVDVPTLNMGGQKMLDEEKKAKEILDVLEGPFRKRCGSELNVNCRLPWETVLIGRRLILIFIKTFTMDVIARLFLMECFNVLFLMHHIYVCPFANHFLNVMETISLTILVIICGLNIMPAYIYMNPTCVSSYIQGFANVFQDIESILMLVFPFVIGSCAVVLACLRILQCLRWLSKQSIRLICSCCKRKTL